MKSKFFHLNNCLVSVEPIDADISAPSFKTKKATGDLLK